MAMLLGLFGYLIFSEEKAVPLALVRAVRPGGGYGRPGCQFVTGR